MWLAFRIFYLLILEWIELSHFIAYVSILLHEVLVCNICTFSFIWIYSILVLARIDNIFCVVVVSSMILKLLQLQMHDH
jgi:hypothetical protein